MSSRTLLNYHLHPYPVRNTRPRYTCASPRVIGSLKLRVPQTCCLRSSSPRPPAGPSAAIVSTFAADFVLTSGTLFVAKVCLPHEQSVGGVLFLTLVRSGTLSSSYDATSGRGRGLTAGRLVWGHRGCDVDRVRVVAHFCDCNTEQACLLLLIRVFPFPFALGRCSWMIDSLPI